MLMVVGGDTGLQGVRMREREREGARERERERGREGGRGRGNETGQGNER